MISSTLPALQKASCNTYKPAFWCGVFWIGMVTVIRLHKQELRFACMRTATIIHMPSSKACRHTHWPSKDRYKHPATHTHGSPLFLLNGVNHVVVILTLVHEDDGKDVNPPPSSINKKSNARISEEEM